VRYNFGHRSQSPRLGLIFVWTLSLVYSFHFLFWAEATPVPFHCHKGHRYIHLYDPYPLAVLSNLANHSPVYEGNVTRSDKWTRMPSSPATRPNVLMVYVSSTSDTNADRTH